MIDTVIVDDVEKAIVVLRRLLNTNCPEINIVGEADDVDDAIRLIESRHPKLVFLDIKMAGKSGFDLLDEIKERNFHVVFVTAHSEYAIKAFRFSVTDYLLKPVASDDLKQAVQKVKRLIEASEASSSHTNAKDTTAMQTLRIPSTNGLAFVYINNIIRLEADGHYTNIYMDSGKHYISSYHLKQFEEHLDSKIFLRLHRSHLINQNQIKSIAQKEGLVIEMKDGARIEVPRRHKEEALKMLQLK
jgi:two-component system, LytTR family, response regulator